MFSRLLLALAAHWVAVMVVTGASVALVIGLVAWQLRKGKRAARPAPEPVPDAEPEVEVAILPPMALPGPRQVRHTVARGFAMLRERVTNRSLRCRTPCFLLIGPAGSGKSTVLRQLRPEALAPADPADALGCRWHFFDRAVAIEIDGRLLHSDQQPAASHQGWLAMHRALRFHRPERPIDGVVLTIPASDLLGPRRLEGSALTARARALFKRLQSAQRILGVRVPLYVVVTKCDLLQGFQDLCTTIPSNMRGESFGWANPYALETAFAPEWIDEAFESLTADLLEVQMELLARGSAEQPEGLFQFSGNFRALQAPVRTFTAELCRESAYQESFFFRGLYFTGDGTPDPGERLLDAPYGYDDAAVAGEDEGSGSSALPAFPATLAVSREPYFLHDLFARKIFGEAGLARPVAKSKLSRNRAILAMQAAIVAILLIGGVGLWRADVVLQREGGLLSSVLSDIQSDLRLMNTDAPDSNGSPSLAWAAGADDRVFPLLSSMARVNESRLASFFVPSSWASSLHWDISESMRQGFTNVVLPSMYSAMLAKADSIVAPSPSDVEHDATTLAGGGDLPHYLSSVALLGRNLERYDTVAFIGAEDTGLKNVAELVQYLFNEQLPPEFMQNQRYHRTALWESYGQRITAKQRPFYSKRVVDRAEVLLRAYYDSLGSRLQEVNDRFSDAEEVQRLTPEELADFRQLRDELVQVKSALDGSEPFWFDESKPVGPSLLAIIDSIPATPLTHPDSIQHDFEQMFYRVRREKLLELKEGLEPLRQVEDGGSGGASVGLTPRLAALQAALDTLFSQPFIALSADAAAAPAAPIPPGSRIRWQLPELDRVLKESAEYQAFVDGQQASGMPGVTRLMEGLAAVQLEARLAGAVRAAMVPEPQAYTFGLKDHERDLRARVAAFQEPAKRLLQILDITNRLGMTATYDEVAGIYLNQALEMLAEADTLLQQSGAYRPIGGSLSGWSGQGPATQAAFGASGEEELNKYLDEQRTRIRYLASTFATPLLGGLTADPLAPYLHEVGGDATGLIAKWSSLVRELDRYDAKSGISSVDVLERFIRDEMTAPDLKTCAANSGRGVGGGSDFFLAARNRLRSQLYSRCEQLAVSKANTSYARLADYFNANLAGRYPFTRDAGVGGPEADPAALRHFYALYDALGAFRGAVNDGSAAAFLDRMASVRAFLGPLMDAKGADGAELAVKVAFRANRARERGADQIVDWQLALGDSPLGYRDAVGPQPTTWYPGAPAVLTLRWAMQSLERPQPGGAGGLAVSDRDAVFSYAGEWSLVRMIQEHGTGSAPGEQGFLLRFEVPVTRRTAAGSTATPAGSAQLFIRLQVGAPEAGPLPSFPTFPTQAPE